MRNALFNEGEHITFHINNIGHIAIGCKKGTLFPLCFGVPCLSKRDLLDRKRIFCVCNNIYFCEMKNYSTSYTLAWILFYEILHQFNLTILAIMKFYSLQC